MNDEVIVIELTRAEAKLLKMLCLLSQKIGRGMVEENHPEAMLAAKADVMASVVMEKLDVAELKAQWEEKLKGKEEKL